MKTTKNLLQLNYQLNPNWQTGLVDGGRSESAREELGITVSYWSDLDSIKKWKANAEHQAAQQTGHQKWYSSFKVRISKVEKDYGVSDA